jgi:hypothetical protein
MLLSAALLASTSYAASSFMELDLEKLSRCWSSHVQTLCSFRMRFSQRWLSKVHSYELWCYVIRSPVEVHGLSGGTGCPQLQGRRVNQTSSLQEATFLPLCLLLAGFSFSYSSDLMMDGGDENVIWHTPEDTTLHKHLCENHKSCIV